MKIAYLCADQGVPILGDKGASVHVREFVTALSFLGHDVSVLCAKRGEGNPPPPGVLIEVAPDDDAGDVTQQAAQLGIAPGSMDGPLRAEVRKLAHDRRLPERVLSALARAALHPDVVYERYALFCRAGAEVAARLSVPRVLEVNAPLVWEQERFRGLRLKNIAQAIEEETFRRADRIVAVSEPLKEHVVQCGVPADRVSVVPNGVDCARFHPALKGERIRRRYGLEGRPVIGFVGSLKAWHGLEFLWEAFASIAERVPGVALLIVGDGPLLPNLKAWVERDRAGDRTIVAGRVPHGDVPEYFAAMDLSMAPYDDQPNFYFSPMKVVESMAAGVPVVAPKLGQLTALIRDGETGVLYSPGARAEFAHAVVALLKDEQRRRAMGLRGRAVAEAEFGWERVAGRVVDMMTDLLAAGPTHHAERVG